MIEKTFTIKNTTGLHARPAAQLVQKALNYKSIVKVKNGSIEGNARSLISILSLGANRGSTITIIADGEDELEAMEGILNLLSSFID